MAEQPAQPCISIATCRDTAELWQPQSGPLEQDMILMDGVGHNFVWHGAF